MNERCLFCNRLTQNLMCDVCWEKELAIGWAVTARKIAENLDAQAVWLPRLETEPVTIGGVTLLARKDGMDAD